MLTRARDHSLRSNGSIGQRLQGRFIDGFANTDARLPSRLRKGRWFSLVEQLADGHVQFFQREELAVAQRRHDPALGHLHGIFDFGFVPRLVRPRGHDAEAAVQREVVIGRIQIRIVAVRLGHAGLGVVGNGQRRNAAESVRRRARAHAATIPSAGRAWPRPRCRNWRPARPRTTAPARRWPVCRS